MPRPQPNTIDPEVTSTADLGCEAGEALGRRLPDPEVRVRVMVGMVKAVEAKGYAATTVGDIAREARISRRTLYENFAGKEDCFLAAYSMMSNGLIGAVVAASRERGDGFARVHAALAAYLDGLAQSPEVARSFLTEINAVGAPGVELRCVVNQRFAAMLAELLSESVGPAGTKLSDGRVVRPVDPLTAVSLVGAINEVVLHAAGQGPADELSERLAHLRAPLIDLIDRVMVAGPPVPSRLLNSIQDSVR